MEEERITCANPECSCAAPNGSDYCSDYCQEPSRDPQDDYDLPLERGKRSPCQCGHAACDKHR